jgi:poly-beta-1,6-N-acetyl-D-glucosamine synthase
MKYVLITSAYNEEDNIEKTIKSVVNQSILPLRWVVISDGSTDNTDAIIKLYAQKYGFIKYFRMEKREKHSYGAKVRAINRGLRELPSIGWDYLGIIDADISFESSYFSALYRNFLADERLGLCGGLIVECHNGRIKEQSISVDSSVAGAVQCFRRGCWERIGEYLPMPHGGEDAAAEIMARSHGWLVRTDTSLKVKHFGFVGKGSGTIYRAKLRRGKSYYNLGYHPVFETARCIKHMLEKPPIIGSLLELWGYAIAPLRGEKRLLPEDIVRFLRREQLSRLFHGTRD